MKFVKLLIFFIIFIGLNPCFAYNWIPVESSDGKIAEVDFDSISKNKNQLTYDVKLSTSQNYYTITKFSINTAANTYAQVSTTSYENDKKKAYTEAKLLQYKQIKPKSLQSELFNTVNLLIGTSDNIANKNAIEKYAKKQQKKISKYWHPNNYDTSIASAQNMSVYLQSYVTIILDKEGNIVSYGYKDYTHGIFTSMLESDINNIINSKIGKFDKFPEDYTGDKLILFIKFEYSDSKNAKTNKAVKSNCNVGYINISKKHSSLLKTTKDIGLFIITLPLAVLYGLLGGK